LKNSSAHQSINLNGLAPSSDTAELAAALESLKERLTAERRRQIELAGTHRNAAKALEGDLKALSTGMAIISGDQPLAVSLLYKRAGSGAYIKGRCWWNGRQHEVQIGSVPAVLAAVAKKHAAPYLDKAAPAGWIDIRVDEALTTAIKEIGRRKLRQLIARRLREHFFNAEDNSAPMVTDGATAEPESPESDSERDEDDGNGNWYASWREHNVGLEAGS